MRRFVGVDRDPGRPDRGHAPGRNGHSGGRPDGARLPAPQQPVAVAGPTALFTAPVSVAVTFDSLTPATVTSGNAGKACASALDPADAAEPIVADALVLQTASAGMKIANANYMFADSDMGIWLGM